jgi:hypothetical protein
VASLTVCGAENLAKGEFLNEPQIVRLFAF